MNNKHFKFVYEHRLKFLIMKIYDKFQKFVVCLMRKKYIYIFCSLQHERCAELEKEKEYLAAALHFSRT